MVRVDTFGGTFQLDPRSHLLSRLVLDGEYEPEVFALCARLVDPERDVVDVGANAGFFSVGLARRLREGRLVAVEPSVAMADRLRANLARNGLAETVTVLQSALSDASGEAVLHTVEGNEEYGTLGVLVHHGLDRVNTLPSAETTPTERLDDIVARLGLRPALLKVDVEGFEGHVFRGAQRTLAEHRPAVVTEFNASLLRANGDSPEALISLFERAGYRVLDPFSPGHPPVTPTFLETTEEVLCLPAEVTP